MTALRRLSESELLMIVGDILSLPETEVSVQHHLELEAINEEIAFRSSLLLEDQMSASKEGCGEGDQKGGGYDCTTMAKSA